MTEIEDLVGERLMIGLAGPTLGDADIRLFRETRATGQTRERGAAQKKHDDELEEPHKPN